MFSCKLPPTEDEELMNEGSFLLSEARRFGNRGRETMTMADIESSDENAVDGSSVGARNNRRRSDIRYAMSSCDLVNARVHTCHRKR